jgi:hypothetical protein
MRLSIPHSPRAPLQVGLLTIACLASVILPEIGRHRAMPPPNTVFEQALAACIWLSITSDDDPSITAELIQERFDQLVASAPPEELGRAYLFLGESDSGRVAVRKVFRERVEELAADGNITPEKLLSPENLPEPVTRIQARLERSLAKLSRVFPTSDRDRQDAFVRYLNGESEFAEQCYLAAVAECPDYIPAWAKLGLNAEGPVRAFALQEWMLRDSGNSLPCYFLAADVVSVDPSEAIRWIERGNRRERCSLPHPVLPTPTQLRYPVSNGFRELGVSGKPVNAVAFSNCRQLINPPFLSWGHPANELRQLCSALRDVGFSDCCSMSKPHCSRLARSMFQMATRLLANDQGDMNLYFAGVVGLSSVEDILTLDSVRCVQETGDRLRMMRRSFQRYAIAELSRRRKESTNEQLFGGTLDYQEVWNGAVLSALRDSRLVFQLQMEFRGV